MGANGLLYGNPSQLLIQAIGVGVAGVMGFFGTYVILKVIDVLIGMSVSQGRAGRSGHSRTC